MSTSTQTGFPILLDPVLILGLVTVTYNVVPTAVITGRALNGRKVINNADSFTLQTKSIKLGNGKIKKKVDLSFNPLLPSKHF